MCMMVIVNFQLTCIDIVRPRAVTITRPSSCELKSGTETVNYIMCYCKQKAELNCMQNMHNSMMSHTFLVPISVYTDSSLAHLSVYCLYSIYTAKIDLNCFDKIHWPAQSEMIDV